MHALLLAAEESSVGYQLGRLIGRLLVIALLKEHGRDSDFARALGSDTKGKISLLCYLAAMVLAFWVPKLALIFPVIVACIWIVPDRRFASVA